MAEDSGNRTHHQALSRSQDYPNRHSGHDDGRSSMIYLRDNMSSAIESDVRYFGRSSHLPDQGIFRKRWKPNFGCTTGRPGPKPSNFWPG
jgi:hypothetical protein